MCWKLNDTLIILNLIDTYKLLCMYAGRVLSPHIWHHVLTTGHLMCFFRISREL